MDHENDHHTPQTSTPENVTLRDNCNAVGSVLQPGPALAQQV